MPRKPRLDYAGAIHHVFDRGNDKKTIFYTDADRQFFLKRLLSIQKEEKFDLFAYCLMDNHFHLLIKTGLSRVGTIFSRLLTSYSWRINTLTGSTGHLFGNRFGSKLCENDAYCMWLLWYIHNNPVKAGLVQRASDWAWSSHRDYLRRDSSVIDIEWPLSLFGGDLAAYSQFIDQRVLEEPGKPSLFNLAQIVLAETGFDPLGGKDCSPGKRLFCARAVECGYSQKEIAAFLRCSKGGVSRMLRK